MVEATPSSANIPVRIVPGAAPAAPLTKSQLKKRKQKNAKARTTAEEGIDSLAPLKESVPADHVPNSNSLGNAEEEKKTTEAGPEPELALHPSTIALEGQKPPSPIVDQIINKRIKTLGKKIQRIGLYSSNPDSTLNEDQKRSIASLPNLEASLKELEEIKKGIEVLEHEHAEKQAALRAVEAKEIDQRIAEAVSYVESRSVLRTRSLVAFLALSTLLVTPIPLTSDQIGDHHVPSDENERNAIIEAGRTILTPEFGNEKDQLLKGILGIQLEGSFMGVTYDRLREIAQQFIHPPTPIPSAPPSPVLAASTDFPEEVTLPEEGVSTPTPGQPLSHPVVTSGSGILTTTSSFQFMSESDLDLEPAQEPVSADQARPTDWVHVDEIAPLEHEEVDPSRSEAVMSEEVQKLVEEEVEEIQAQELGAGETPIDSIPLEAEEATLDWAADEGGLPSLSALENSFGKSGAATPVAPSTSTLPNSLPSNQFNHTNGYSRVSPDPRENPTEQGSEARPQQRHRQQPSQVQPDADGFMSIPGRRPRGALRGGGDRSQRGRGSWDGRGGYGGPRGGGGGDRGGRRGGPGNEQGGFGSGWNGAGGNGAGEPAPGTESYRGRGGPRGSRGAPPDFGGNSSYNGNGRGRGGYSNGDRGGGGYRNHGDEDGGRGRGRGRGGGGPHRGARGFADARVAPPHEA